jgi:hypothetical protein
MMLTVSFCCGASVAIGTFETWPTVSAMSAYRVDRK